jgi:formiminotetrahydrofolate cyclodeaminase
MYLDKPLREYLDDLASRKPAPGGGSSAALIAALGAGLMSMTANYTIGNEKYKANEEKVAELLIKVEKARLEFASLVDKDVETYNKLSAGIKELGKDSEKLGELYREAADVPFDICRLSGECMKLCAILVDVGNKNLITDTAAAAVFFESAFFVAKFNVYDNLRNVKDMEYIEKVHKALAPLEEEMPKLREEIVEKCEDVVEK